MKTKLVLISLVACFFFLVNGAFAEEQKKSEKNTPDSSEQVKQKTPEQGAPAASELVEKKKSKKNGSAPSEPVKKEKSDSSIVKVAKKQKKDQQNCQDQIKVKVKGMVCDYCVGALTKVFKKQSGYAGLDVDLEAGHVVLSMQPGKTLKDETIKTLVKDAGYDVKSIHKGCDS